MDALKISLEEAEKKAKERDFAKNIDLVEVAKQEQLANDQGFGIYKLKEKNKAYFVQTIQENLEMIILNGYLSNAELGFLFSLFPMVQLHSNAIVKRDTGQFMTVSEIAKFLNRNRSGISTNIQSLLEKGILLEIVDAQEIKEYQRNVSKRPLFMNPELVYAGDRNKINATLAKLVFEFDKLERKKIMLPWKLFLKNGEEHAKLYSRKTYLEFKKQMKGKNK